MYGLKRMSSPVTAPSGIFVAGLGMLVAVLASFLYVFDVSAAAKPHLMVNVGLGVVALIVGGGVAWWAGRKVAMTAMPQMVAIYNGMGGGAAGAIAAVELFGNKAAGTTQLVVTLLGRADRRDFAVRLVDRVGQASKALSRSRCACGGSRISTCSYCWAHSPSAGYLVLCGCKVRRIRSCRCRS